MQQKGGGFGGNSSLLFVLLGLRVILFLGLRVILLFSLRVSLLFLLDNLLLNWGFLNL